MFSVLPFQCWPVEAGYVTVRHFGVVEAEAEISVLACGSRLCHFIASDMVQQAKGGFQCWPVEAGYVTLTAHRFVATYHADFSAGLWKQAMSLGRRLAQQAVRVGISVLACGSRLCHLAAVLRSRPFVSAFQCWPVEAGYVTEDEHHDRGNRCHISVLACGSRLCHRWYSAGSGIASD